MTDKKRACMAFICGMKVNPSFYRKYIVEKSNAYKFYSYLLYDWTNSNIRIFDIERNGFIQGKPSLLFDYTDDSYITLDWNGNSFRGFDYKSQSHYMGLVQDNLIQIFDYETSQYYLYELK